MSPFSPVKTPADEAREAEHSLFSSYSYDIRAASIDVLTFCGVELALPPLSKFLSSLEGNVLMEHEQRLAKHAVIALGDFRSSAALPAIMRAFDLRHISIIEQVFCAIEKIGDLSAVPFLASHLQDEFVPIPLSALHSIEKLKADFAYPSILPMLLSDSYDMRYPAADVISKFGKSYEAIAWLTLQMKQDASMRVVATQMLSYLRREAAKAGGKGASPFTLEGIDFKRFPAARRTLTFANPSALSHGASAKAVLV